MQATKHRFYVIDLLRFAAAFMVVMFHYTFRGAADHRIDIAFPALGAVFKYGYFGVDLFFIVSGFVILRTALPRNAREFVVSRITRLFPAYWVCVTLTFVFILALGADHFHASFWQFIVNLTMLQEFVHVKSLDGVYWTLAVELKFYFLVFVLVLLRQMRRLQHFLVLWLAVSALLDWVGGPAVLYFLLFPEYSYFFIAGAAFLLIRLHGLSLARVALVIGSYAGAVHHALGAADQLTAHFATTFGYIAVAGIVTAYFAAFSLIALGKVPALERPAFVAIGALTYPLYLLHENIGFMIFNALDRYLPSYVLLLANIALMLAAAYAVHRFVERRYARPLQRLLERVLALAPTKGTQQSAG